MEKYDIVIFGATGTSFSAPTVSCLVHFITTIWRCARVGFTGQFVVEELHRVVRDGGKSHTYAVAGRSESKVKGVCSVCDIDITLLGPCSPCAVYHQGCWRRWLDDWETPKSRTSPSLWPTVCDQPVARR
jgi:hypothetical protein